MKRKNKYIISAQLICCLTVGLILGCDSSHKDSNDLPKSQPLNSSIQTPTNMPLEVATPPSNMPADCFFYTPGDVTVVTDGTDFRLRIKGGQIGSEVFATKQEAIDYIYKMHKIMHPAEGKNYQPAQ